MAVKTNQELKRKKKAEKKAKVDKVTNWFMINLAWGVFGFIILRYMTNPLLNDFGEVVDGNMIPAPLKESLGNYSIFFCILAIVLIVWGIISKFRVIKCSENAKACVRRLFDNGQRFINYGIFTAVIAVVCFYLSIYLQVMDYAYMNFPSWVKPDSVFVEREFWATGALSYAIGAYLLVAFIYTSIRVIIIEKKK